MSRGLTSGMVTEVTATALRPIFLFKAEFDSGDLLLWTGVGPLTYNSETYVGGGNLIGVSEMKEVSVIEAQGASFQLSGIPSALLSLALSEPYQGRPITCFFGSIDSSGALVANPFTLFKGKMDVMKIDDSAETVTITVSAENRLIDLQRIRVRRYTPEDQKQKYAGDLGLDFVAALQEKEVVWGKS